MKALLLALVVSSPLMTPATPDPKISSDDPFAPSTYGQVYDSAVSAPESPKGGSAPYYICGPGEVWRAFYYRQNQSMSSPECGLKYWYCDGPPYVDGCVTPYYTTTIYCGCP